MEFYQNFKSQPTDSIIFEKPSQTHKNKSYSFHIAQMHTLTTCHDYHWCQELKQRHQQLQATQKRCFSSFFSHEQHRVINNLPSLKGSSQKQVVLNIQLLAHSITLPLTSLPLVMSLFCRWVERRNIGFVFSWKYCFLYFLEINNHEHEKIK